MYVLAYLHLYKSFSKRFLLKIAIKNRSKNHKQWNPKSTQGHPKSDLELQESGSGADSASRAVLDRFWMDLGCTFGQVLGGKLGPCWDPKLIFTGIGRRLKMSTKLKAFRDRFYSDFQCQNRIKIVPKSISRVIKIQSCASSVSPIFTNENQDAASGRPIKNQSKNVWRSPAEFPLSLIRNLIQNLFKKAWSSPAAFPLFFIRNPIEHQSKKRSGALLLDFLSF